MDLALRGDIEQILEQAQRLEQGDARYAPFAAKLRGLARGFQVKKICEFLESERPAS